MLRDFRDTLARILEITAGFLAAQLALGALLEDLHVGLGSVRDWLVFLAFLVIAALVVVAIRTASIGRRPPR
jgi:hypothetical protein